MEYGLIRFGSTAYHDLTLEYPTCAIAVNLSKSQTKAMWSDHLAKMGFSVEAEEPQAEDLFGYVKAAFEKQKGKKLDIRLVRGYVASADGNSPVTFAEASRLYSSKDTIYLDELVSNALFEYIATYYIWAKDYTDSNVFTFCFQYMATILNYASRLGLLTNDEKKSELITQISTRCDDNAVNLISDLYWSCLAFAFCHEIAHIYLDHTEYAPADLEEAWSLEYAADAVGYDVYLQIIQSAKDHSRNPFAGVFHDYLYTAPMILLKHYEDTYYLGYWLFGERTGNSHPPLNERINKLLQISEQEQYTFDTNEGNILLNNYLDVSDWFREQLILKLQRGKLNNFIQKGVAFVSKPGYSEAIQFQQNMCDDLLCEADKLGIDSNLVIGLWNTAVDIELLNSPGEHGFVWSYNGKTYSTKAFNVSFSMKKLLMSVLDFGASFQLPDGEIKTVLIALSILYKLIDASTIKLDDLHAQILLKCHLLNAYEHPVPEEVLLEIPGVSSESISALEGMGCIQITDGFITLRERILIR